MAMSRGRCSVILMCLTGSPEVAAAVAAMKPGLAKGTVVVDCSTSDPTVSLALAAELAEIGVEVVDDRKARVHVTGHACREELVRMYQALQPKIAVPVHGEYRHLVEHVKLADSLGIPHTMVVPNGNMITLSEEGVRVVDQVETSRVYVDGNVQVGAFDGVIRDRLRLARQGHVSVVISLSLDGEVLGDCEVRSFGIPKNNNGWPYPFDELIAREVDLTLKGLGRSDLKSDNKVEEILDQTTKRAANKWWGKKPEITVICMRMDTVD